MPLSTIDASRVSPLPTDRRRYDWGGGVFETARRSPTPIVEGRLEPAVATVMVTLRGGAAHHELVTDDGYRFSGPDCAGSMSFLPAGCGRRLTLRGVAWQWASLTVKPEALAGDGEAVTARPFTARHDPVVLGLLTEMERLHALEGRLDATYCDSLSLAITQYVGRKFWRVDDRARRTAPDRLPPWRLRRVVDYIDAHLDQELRIADLASLIGLSEGHLHRAFRATTGQTPLAYITAQRIERARQLLITDDQPIGAVAARVGFVSQSHFARVFHAVTGSTPRAYRKQLRHE